MQIHTQATDRVTKPERKGEKNIVQRAYNATINWQILNQILIAKNKSQSCLSFLVIKAEIISFLTTCAFKSTLTLTTIIIIML